MSDENEILGSHSNATSESVQIAEQDRLKLYGEVIYREATSLLGKYLPEALPQEPTEMFIGVIPQYMGKFRDKHCVALERDPQLDPLVQIMQEHLRDMQ